MQLCQLYITKIYVNKAEIMPKTSLYITKDETVE